MVAGFVDWTAWMGFGFLDGGFDFGVLGLNAGFARTTVEKSAVGSCGVRRMRCVPWFRDQPAQSFRGWMKPWMYAEICFLRLQSSEPI